MTSLKQIDEALWELGGEAKLGPGIYFPCRMVIVRLEGGKLLLHSPVALEQASIDAINALGQVTYLVAPNSFHHLFMDQAQQQWPQALVWGPQALKAKRPDLRFDHELEQANAAPWASALEPIAIHGAPKLSEWAFWHQASSTLIVTDFIFNIRQTKNAATQLMLKLTGAFGRPIQSRYLGSLIKDRSAANASAKQLLSKPIARLIMAHGQIIDQDAHAATKAAMTRVGPLA